MALLNGLTKGGRHADGQVAGYLFSAYPFSREGKHIRGFVLAAELTIEAADGSVCGEQHGDLALEVNGCLCQRQEARQCASGGEPKIARLDFNRRSLTLRRV